MYIEVLWILTIVFTSCAIAKMNSHKQEWLILLLMLSSAKTMITYLFASTTVFTLVSIGSIDIHLDDIILVWLFLYCIYKLVFCKIKTSKFFLPIIFYSVPVIISVMRGLITGKADMSGFVNDTRKFILFLVVMLAAYLVLRNKKAFYRADKMQSHVNIFMNCVLVYVLVIWALDLFLGIHSLPGQYNGTLSDGGSTFRIINPPQVLMIAFYTMYLVYIDLEKKSLLGLRTLCFTVVIIFLQWRTVVAAFVVGLFVIAVLHFIKTQKMQVNLLLEIIGIIGLAIGMVFAGGGSSLISMVQKLFSSFANVFAGTGTFSTRTMVWAELLGSLKGIDKIFGRPFGYTNTSLSWQNSAHSGYVDFIVVAGYFGLACLILLIVYILVQCIKKHNIILSATIIALAVYWFGYGFSIEQAALLGIILGVLENYEIWLGEYGQGALYRENGSK